MRGVFSRSLTLALGGTAFVFAGPVTAQAETITLWSHWADHKTKVEFVEEAARTFEERHPDVDVEITWYQKDPLYAALKTALRAGQGS